MKLIKTAALVMCVSALIWAATCTAPSRPNKPAVAPTPAQLEAKRKCPDGPYYRCGELIGPYADDVFQLGGKKILGKDMPPHERTFGGVRYKIPYSFAKVMDPTGASAGIVAFWIPLAHMVNGSEVAGTKLAREALKLGVMSPYGVRILLKAHDSSLRQRSTYDSCKPRHIDADALPTKLYFDMTMYVDRSAKGKLATHTHCYVSDDPAYEFYPGIPVSYFVPFTYSFRDGNKATPKETRAKAAFTLHNDKVFVEYLFQTDMLPYWKEIHTAVLKLVQSWEQ